MRQRLRRLSRRSRRPCWTLGLAQELLGLTAEAVASFERAVALTSGSPLMLAQYGRALARAGGVREARAVAERLHGGEVVHVPTPYFTAALYAVTGDVDPALDSLERSARLNDGALPCATRAGGHGLVAGRRGRVHIGDAADRPLPLAEAPYASPGPDHRRRRGHP